MKSTTSLPQKHRGQTSLENLCLACAQCNAFKGSNIAGYDPVTGELTSLFNPRTHIWTEHFHWNGPTLVGTTPIARATDIRPQHQFSRAARTSASPRNRQPVSTPASQRLNARRAPSSLPFHAPFSPLIRSTRIAGPAPDTAAWLTRFRKICKN